MKLATKSYLFLFFSFSLILSNNDIPFPSFHKAMSNYSKQYSTPFASKNALWQKIKKMYDTYLIDDLQYSEKPRIPKVIHQIWLGGPIPAKYDALRETWKKFHPDWEYKLWTDADAATFDMINRDAFNDAKNVGQKADIFRCEILYQFGGLYIDTDFECFRSFDLLHHCLDFYTGIGGLGGPDKFGLFNGIIAATPHHPILRACVETIDIHAKYSNNWVTNIMYTTGPVHLCRCFLEKCNEGGRCVAFPTNYFYPWPHYEKRQNKRNQILRWKRPETFAIHHWHCAWQK